MDPITLTPQSARHVADLVHALLTIQPPPQKETYSLADLRVVLDCESDSAVYRTLEKLRVRAYSPGKYRVKDVRAGMERASLAEHKKAGYIDEKGRGVMTA